MKRTVVILDAFQARLSHVASKLPVWRSLPRLSPPTKIPPKSKSLQDHDNRCANDTDTDPRLPHPSPTMPREVSDIKQFIEICRRKDAKCTFSPKNPSSLNINR